MQKLTNEITWQDNIALCAQRLSMKIEEAFVFEMKAADKFLPYNFPEALESKTEEDQRIEQVAMFCDYSIGTIVALLAHYCTTEKEFEEYFIEQVSDKFNRLRKINHGPIKAVEDSVCDRQ